MKKPAAVFCFLLLLLFIARANAAPAISDVDRTRIAEAFRTGEKIQDQLWPDWHTAPFSMLFVTDEYEFLIRHPKPSDEFQSIGYDKILKSEVFVRPRKFPKTFLATFPAFGRTPVIVVGKAENTTDKTSSRWVFVVLHEHFHQLQYSRPTYFDDVIALNLSHGDTSGMWQINFPFPYKTKEVADRFRQLTNDLLAAYESRHKTDAGEKLNKYRKARQEFGSTLSSDDYKYASFQLWQEGIARYTQYRMAALAARKVKPSKAFRKLSDYTPFKTEADRLLKVMLEEMRTLDLGEWQRTVFYPFGAVEGLLLDDLNPTWRSDYFVNKFDLTKFYPAEKNK